MEFLPRAAEELYAVMIDPDLGQCLPAQPEGGLLIDPTVAEARSAIIDSFRRASEQQATLILAYIGHGEYARSVSTCCLATPRCRRVRTPPCISSS